MDTYAFRSASKPDAPPHVATCDEDGFIQCSCPGYKWRNKCKHVTMIESGGAKPEPRDSAEIDDGDISFDVASFGGDE